MHGGALGRPQASRGRSGPIANIGKPHLVKRLRASISKRFARLLSFPALVKRHGATFLLDPRDWIDNRLIARAPFEDAQIARSVELIDTRRLDAFLDIGANFGLYTVILGRLPQIKEVHAFEPVRRNFAQLMGNVFANELSAKVSAYRLALGPDPGSATIHIDPRSHGVSRIDLADAGRDLRAFAQTENIDIARLDDVLALSGRRCYVKIDVEGFASRVLVGMEHFLANNTVVLQVEMLASEKHDVLAHFARLGFRHLGDIEGDSYFASADADGASSRAADAERISPKAG